MLQENADLVSITNEKENFFLVSELQKREAAVKQWHVSARREGLNRWFNLDQTELPDLTEYFHQKDDESKDHLAYVYSEQDEVWGFEPISGPTKMAFICEIPVDDVAYWMTGERSVGYGQKLGVKTPIQKGPRFIREPEDVVFDVTRRKEDNNARLRCVAESWPAPKYKWFKQSSSNSKDFVEIDPLNATRYTMFGGQLIINIPDQLTDRGSYYCTASNQFGVIRSRAVTLAFGYISDFSSKRNREAGSENWGKAIACDPPQHFPDIRMQWSKGFHSNFVQENERTLISQDGHLYFSALEKSDQGNYSCSVKSMDEKQSKKGPFFTLEVNPHPNFQQLRFPQKFPQVFPQTPAVGDTVRMECITFGYPTPKYNWTRKNGVIPVRANLTSFNRILTIPDIKIEDQDDYVCNAYNDKVSITGSVSLEVKSRPKFESELQDMLIDEFEDITWACRASGIPQVSFQWLKDGKVIEANELRGRIEIINNLLIIRRVS